MDEPLEIVDSVLTTRDNPYNPREDYNNWRQWDRDAGYYTEEYLARVANLSIDDDSEEAEVQLMLAKVEIIDNDMENIYILV